MAGGWNQEIFKVPSKPNYSGILNSLGEVERQGLRLRFACWTEADKRCLRARTEQGSVLSRMLTPL